MRSSPLFCLLSAIIFTLNPVAALSFETDQYNLSPVPLADIGEEVSAHTATLLLHAVARLNSQIALREACLDKTQREKGTCGSTNEERQKLAFLRSPEGLAGEAYVELGAGGLLETGFVRWVRTHKFPLSPSQFKTRYDHSIYILLPTNYITISPTVRLYGAEMGTDKIDHFFQQGHKYYTIRRKNLKRGLSVRQAEQRAIIWGRKTEKTYFGYWVSGVYSNADLFANYAGMKFYQRLTENVRIGEAVYGPLFAVRDGYWNVAVDDENWKRDLLKPFMTDHMNEALNPSGYSFILFSTVKKMAAKYGCPDWRKANPDLSKSDFEMRTKSLEKWGAEDYGFVRKKHVVTVAETCFAAKIPTD